MDTKKTVAFVATYFGWQRNCGERIETQEREGHRALLMSDLAALKFIRDVDEVLLFLDCGEEMLVYGLPEIGVPSWKFHFVICAKNVGAVLKCLRHVGLSNPPITPSECGGMETVTRMVSEYLASGKVAPPTHAL